jgi:hypothetical protein
MLKTRQEIVIVTQSNKTGTKDCIPLQLLLWKAHSKQMRKARVDICSCEPSFVQKQSRAEQEIHILNAR